MALTAIEIKNQVVNKYQEGQAITLWLTEGERGEAKPNKVKILKLNPNGVLVERKGNKETYSYWEIKTLLSKPIKRDAALEISEPLIKRKIGAYHRTYNTQAQY